MLMGVMWPLFSWPSRLRSQNSGLALSWAVTCLVTAVFPLLGVDKKETLSAM